MSGLILAGIGKGIAEAGNFYASAMTKSALDRESEERKIRLADELETKKEEKRAAQAIAVDKLADEAPLKRDVGVLQGKAAQVEGDSPVMSKEEMLKLIKENPEYREVYRKAGLIGEDKMDPRLRRADDEERAAREVGVSSSVLESYRKAKSDTLAIIKQENRDARDDAKEERRGKEFAALLPIRQQQADAGTTRANKPSGSGGGTDSGEKIFKTITGADGNEYGVTRSGKKIDLGASSTFNKQVSTTIASMEKNDFSFSKLPEDEKRAKAIARLTGGSNTPKPSDNSTSRPALDSFRR